MPTILRIKGYRFFFYSNEGDEPMHIHIEKAGAIGKMRLHPTMEEDYFYGFNTREVKEIKSIVAEYIEQLKLAWNEYFGQ
jgi:hypothetical protein